MRPLVSVSLVDGYNLPVAVTNSVGCPEASCPVDLAPNCASHTPYKLLRRSNSSRIVGPTELKGPFDSNGVAVGCKSACAAGLGGDPGTSRPLLLTAHNAR